MYKRDVRKSAKDTNEMLVESIMAKIEPIIRKAVFEGVGDEITITPSNADSFTFMKVYMEYGEKMIVATHMYRQPEGNDYGIKTEIECDEMSLVEFIEDGGCDMQYMLDTAREYEEEIPCGRLATMLRTENRRIANGAIKVITCDDITEDLPVGKYAVYC